MCHKHFEFEKMQGDHITPWSKGGKQQKTIYRYYVKIVTEKTESIGWDLYLSFGSYKDEVDAVTIGKMVLEELKAAGFEVESCVRLFKYGYNRPLPPCPPV